MEDEIIGDVESGYVDGGSLNDPVVLPGCAEQSGSDHSARYPSHKQARAFVSREGNTTHCDVRYGSKRSLVGNLSFKRWRSIGDEALVAGRVWPGVVKWSYAGARWCGLGAQRGG